MITKLAGILPELMGGSADLTGSNNTRWPDAVDFQPESTRLGTYAGRYVRFGVREHGMLGIMNGMAAYGNIIPFGGTFLNFVSYGVGSLRLAALSQVRTITVATHDSIGLGEDGPTHQPIETVASLRATPNTHVWRPADGNETSAAYYSAISTLTAPSVLCLTRQNLDHLENSSIEKAVRGGYVALDTPNAKLTIVSTGSEVSLSIDAAKLLGEKGIPTRVVSLPCWEVFDMQDKAYRLQVLPDGIPILSVEVYTTLGWEKYSHEQFGINSFGASGPYKEVYKKFDMTPEGVSQRGQATVEFWKGVSNIRSPINRAF